MWFTLVCLFRQIYRNRKGLKSNTVKMSHNGYADNVINTKNPKILTWSLKLPSENCVTFLLKFSCFHERVLVVVISRCSVCLEVFISANLWVCFLRTSAPRGEDWICHKVVKSSVLDSLLSFSLLCLCIGALLQQLGMFISVIYPNRQPMLINRQDYFKLERISVCDPLQILTFIFWGFILHAQKAANNRNMRIHLIISHYAPAALLRAEKICIYIYIFSHRVCQWSVRSTFCSCPCVNLMLYWHTRCETCVKDLWICIYAAAGPERATQTVFSTTHHYFPVTDI